MALLVELFVTMIQGSLTPSVLLITILVLYELLVSKISLKNLE